MDAGIIEDEQRMAARCRAYRANIDARPLRGDYSDCTCPDNGDSCDPCAAYHADRESWALAVDGAADAAIDMAKDGG